MHRELPHQSSKVAAPIVLKGTTSIKRYGERSTLGSWEKLIDKSRKSERVVSPKAVQRRHQEYTGANRTIYPEKNKEEVKHKTRRITSQEHAENPGNLTNLFKKTGTLDTVYNGTKKKFFKEKAEIEETTPQEARRQLRVNVKRDDDYCSHISTLASPTYKERPNDLLAEELSPRFRCASAKMRIDFLKSSIGALPLSKETRRPYQDEDERKIMQSAYSPRVAQHLESSYQSEPLFKSPPKKKDPNEPSYGSYETPNRIQPWTKGKKTAYPEYLERNTTHLVSPRSGTPGICYSARNGGVEPLDALCQGRRAVKPQAYVSNFTTPPVERDNNRGYTMFSYRTYTSQITF